MLKKTKFYRTLFFAGLIFWWAETAYFGWNKTPISAIERMCDITAQILIIFGVIGDIATNLTIKKDTIINTQTTNLNNSNPDTG